MYLCLMSTLWKDLRHSPATGSCRDNDVNLHPFRNVAKLGDGTTDSVVPVRADQSALKQAGKEIA